MGGRRTKVITSATAEEKKVAEPVKKAKLSARQHLAGEEKKKAGIPSVAKRSSIPSEEKLPKRARPRGRGKRYLAAMGKVESGRSYAISEAIKLVKDTSFARFDASVEAHINLGLDPDKQEHRIRTTAVLPHGAGKVLKVLVFAEGDKAKAALDVGADAIGDEDAIEKISQSGNVAFDAIVATPAFMPKLARAARVLGPKGLMPSPKSGTISDEPAKIVAELKQGRVELKTEAQPIVHAVVGKISFSDKALEENFKAILDTLNRAKPSGVRGEYIKSVYLKSTMGPSVKVAI